MRGRSICFFIILIVCYQAKSQNTLPENSIEKKLLISGPLASAPTQFQKSPKNIVVIPALNIPVKTIPATYYKQTLGFFCKKELELEKAIKFPVKFRLGSVEYTDKLEGKGTGTLRFRQ